MERRSKLEIFFELVVCFLLAYTIGFFVGEAKTCPDKDYNFDSGCQPPRNFVAPVSGKYEFKGILKDLKAGESL